MTTRTVALHFVVGLFVAGLCGLASCSSRGTVEHPDDVNRLLCDSSADCGYAAKFEPIAEQERVEVVLPPPEPYRLGIGDAVNVSVPGQEEFIGFGETSQGQVVGIRVKEDGHLYLPYVEKVPAAGRTVLETQADIQARLRRQFPKAFVSLDVLEPRSQRFYVIGQVHNPAAFPVDGQTTLMDGILMAGGLIEGEADLDEAYIMRDGEVLPISLDDVLRKGDVSGDLVMRHKDLIFVPNVRDRKDFVYVLGEVQNPGAVPMEQETGKGTVGELTLTAAIAAVGGLDLDNAAQDQIRIFRGGWKYPRAFTLSSSEIYKYGESICLQPGDRILVAPSGLATWGRSLKHFMPAIAGAASITAVAVSAAALAK